MRNKILVASLFSAVILIGCGGSGSSDSKTYSGTITKNGVKYTCSTEAAFDACKINNDCSSCTNDAPAPAPEKPKETACATSGNTVLVDEGTTCTDGADTLSCKDSKVTLNNSITSGKITINGKVYTCQ
ncbi:MAG: hypothetical protein U9N11_00245 [Campylobacterota bacterium]|nr:hypothetical protein [Campylobacterota bacterium]